MVFRWLEKLYFCSFLRMVSRILLQNLTAGRVWSKNCGEGEAQATSKILDLDVSVLLIEATRPRSPSSNCYLLPRADLSN